MPKHESFNSIQRIGSRFVTFDCKCASNDASIVLVIVYEADVVISDAHVNE